MMAAVAEADSVAARCLGFAGIQDGDEAERITKARIHW